MKNPRNLEQSASVCVYLRPAITTSPKCPVARMTIALLQVSHPRAQVLHTSLEQQHLLHHVSQTLRCFHVMEMGDRPHDDPVPLDIGQNETDQLSLDALAPDGRDYRSNVWPGEDLKITPVGLRGPAPSPCRWQQPHRSHPSASPHRQQPRQWRVVPNTGQ